MFNIKFYKCLHLEYFTGRRMLSCKPNMKIYSNILYTWHRNIYPQCYSYSNYTKPPNEPIDYKKDKKRKSLSPGSRLLQQFDDTIPSVDEKIDVNNEESINKKIKEFELRKEMISKSNAFKSTKMKLFGIKRSKKSLTPGIRIAAQLPQDYWDQSEDKQSDIESITGNIDDKNGKK